MAFTALVTLLLLMQYLTFSMLVGRERLRHDIRAPAVTGHESFERAYRVQMNTLEQLVVVVPAMWIVAGFFFLPIAAPLLGLAFFAGRVLYRNAYIRDPQSRTMGMAIGMLSMLGLLVLALWGTIAQL
ncbi:MAPEG family protein [Chromatocurvus halotolerans]|uniref:Putative membrane protein YecN with MAPEG domain n=1 Tax=Chromatocurvus halotolerans TaxID=1132028 RepID=A0A4R2KBX2_9GAMM|nr:MAPEG family protein [Chromatocurvus halotolerans]TCO71011.1 putative membrane protein YecN with MAPEG domain [Chromatocurvus halotolerans]